MAPLFVLKSVVFLMFLYENMNKIMNLEFGFHINENHESFCAKETCFILCDV